MWENRNMLWKMWERVYKFNESQGIPITQRVPLKYTNNTHLDRKFYVIFYFLKNKENLYFLLAFLLCYILSILNMLIEMFFRCNMNVLKG